MNNSSKPSVVWLEDYGIQLEWDINGRHLEIEIHFGGASLPYLTEQDKNILVSDEVMLGPSEAVDQVRRLFDWLFDKENQ